MQTTLRMEAAGSSKTLVSSTRLHGVTCKKIELIIIVAVIKILGCENKFLRNEIIFSS